VPARNARRSITESSHPRAAAVTAEINQFAVPRPRIHARTVRPTQPMFPYWTNFPVDMASSGVISGFQAGNQRVFANGILFAVRDGRRFTLSWIRQAGGFA